MGALKDSEIRAAKPRPVRYEIHDSGGLYLRVEPSGAKSFYSRFMVLGKLRLVRLGTYADGRTGTGTDGPLLTLADARAEHARLKAQAKAAREGQAPDPAAARLTRKAEALAAPTVEEFVGEYIERYAKLRKRSWQEDRRILLADVVPLLGEIKLRDLTKRHVTRVLDRIADRGAHNAAWQALKIVRKMCAFAVARGVLDANPCTGIVPAATFGKKDRYLDDDELRALLHALPVTGWNEATKLCLLFQLLTLTRPSEAREATWQEFNLPARVWTIPKERAKNGRAHVVPLSAQALAVIEQARALDGGPYLFPGEPDPTQPKARAPLSEQALGRALIRSTREGTERAPAGSLRAAGVGRFTPHDLRRTGATHLARLGHGLAVPKLLDHAERTVTREHYDLHSYLPEKRAALDVWGERIDALRQGEAAEVIPLRAA
jgi:integrase